MGSSSRFPTIAQGRTILRDVTILRGKTSVEVHIEASNSVKPVARVFTAPQRIVVDLAGVANDRSRRLDVNYGDVEDVRIGLFKTDPPVTRVVVDLTHAHQYRLMPAGKTVILAIDTGPGLTPPSHPAAGKIPSIPATIAVPPATQTSVAAKVPPLPAPAPPSKAPSAEVAQPEAPKPAETKLPAVPPTDASASVALPEGRNLPVPTEEAQLSSAAEDETTPHQAAKGNKSGVVRNVTVSHDKDFVEVRVEGSKPLRASASTLSNPERIIIDLADVRVRSPRHIAVNTADVQAVDVALFLVNPLVTRLTVDLSRACPYRVRASGNSLTVRIGREQVRAIDTQLVP